MRIGGLEKFTLADYDDHLSATVFTQGCNFRCPYCHNPELVDAHRFEPPIPEEDVLDFLARRRGQLDGVCISGGEPTLHADLPAFCRRVKALGYDVKLDTNGTNPDMLALLLRERLVDYVAMDYKAPLAKYGLMCGCAWIRTPSAAAWSCCAPAAWTTSCAPPGSTAPGACRRHDHAAGDGRLPPLRLAAAPPRPHLERLDALRLHAVKAWRPPWPN
jgi:pyruvate formate lyase activating enzyme